MPKTRPATHYHLPSSENMHAPGVREDAKRANCDEQEAVDLGASEIACAVADAIADIQLNQPAVFLAMDRDLRAAGIRLEAATRGSAMRRVRK